MGTDRTMRRTNVHVGEMFNQAVVPPLVIEDRDVAEDAEVCEILLRCYTEGVARLGLLGEFYDKPQSKIATHMPCPLRAIF